MRVTGMEPIWIERRKRKKVRRRVESERKQVTTFRETHTSIPDQDLVVVRGSNDVFFFTIPLDLCRSSYGRERREIKEKGQLDCERQHEREGEIPADSHPQPQAENLPASLSILVLTSQHLIQPSIPAVATTWRGSEGTRRTEVSSALPRCSLLLLYYYSHPD